MQNQFGKHKAIIFTGPSGGGKTTLSQYTLGEFDKVERSISVTTRAPREGELQGKDYHFISVRSFRKHIDNNDFIEWEQVYEGLYYGTLKSEVLRIWDVGKVVLFVVDVIGAHSLKTYFGDNAIKIFVKTPSIEILEHRLLKRGTENKASVSKRIQKAKIELEHEEKADTVIINDNLEDAKNAVKKIIQSYIN